MPSKTTNFKYVHGTKQRENPENTMTKSMFATDKWGLRRSLLSPSSFLGTGSLKAYIGSLRNLTNPA